MSPDEKKISNSQVLRIAKKIKKELFGENISDSKKRTYLRLIGEVRYGSFLKRYKVSPRESFNIGVVDSTVNKQNSIACRFAKKYKLQSVTNTYYLRSKSEVKKGDWLLLMKLKEDKVNVISWLHVSDVIRLKEVEGYSSQAVQLRKKENILLSPFKVTKKFKDAIRTLIRKYGLDGIGYIPENDAFMPPLEVVSNIASLMRGEPIKPPKGSL